MIKYLLMCKGQQNKACFIVLRNIVYKTNNFLMAEAKIILLLIEPISKKENLYRDNFDRKDLASINKAVKIPSRNEDTKILDVRYILFENKYTTCR